MLWRFGLVACCACLIFVIAQIYIYIYICILKFFSPKSLLVSLPSAADFLKDHYQSLIIPVGLFIKYNQYILCLYFTNEKSSVRTVNSQAHLPHPIASIPVQQFHKQLSSGNSLTRGSF